MEDSRRYYSLDALRGSMMMLGIVLHGAQWYVAEPIGGIPIPSDPSTSYVFDLLVYFIHAFRMPLFFVMAGFFTSLLIDKRGLKGTLLNRAKRIALPLLVAILTILPLAIWFAVAFMLSARFGTHQLIPDMGQLEQLGAEMAEAGLPINEPSFGHLWFLYYLLYFYSVIPLCMLLANWGKGLGAIAQKIAGSPALMFALGLICAASLWSFRGAIVFEGFIYVRPHLPSLIYYGLFFVAGYLFHSHRAVLGICKRYFSLNVVLVLFLFPLSVWLSRLDLAGGSVGSVHLYAVLVHGLCTWALIYTFMGLFLRYLDYPSPWILYISQCSYWVYLVHLPVISLAAWFMLPFELHAFVKFSLIVVFTAVFSLVSYHYWIQGSWVSVLLNGRRFDLGWPWRERGDGESQERLRVEYQRQQQLNERSHGMSGAFKDTL